LRTSEKCENASMALIQSCIRCIVTLNKSGSGTRYLSTAYSYVVVGLQKFNKLKVSSKFIEIRRKNKQLYYKTYSK
jgi:hypothetical protein